MEEVSPEELEELRSSFEATTKSNALLELENEVFESYLTRHHQVRAPFARPGVARAAIPAPHANTRCRPATAAGHGRRGGGG